MYFTVPENKEVFKTKKKKKKSFLCGSVVNEPDWDP